MLGGEHRGWGDGVVERGKLYGSLGKETKQGHSSLQWVSLLGRQCNQRL